MTAVQYPYHMQSGVKSTDKATNQLHLNKDKCLQIAIVIVDFSVKFSIELSWLYLLLLFCFNEYMQDLKQIAKH